MHQAVDAGGTGLVLEVAECRGHFVSVEADLRLRLLHWLVVVLAIIGKLVDPVDNLWLLFTLLRVDQ